VEIREFKGSIEEELKPAEEQVVSLQEMVASLRKALQEEKREKEKLAVLVKQQEKQLSNLEKRKEVLDGDSTRFYEDFKEAMLGETSSVIL